MGGFGQQYIPFIGFLLVQVRDFIGLEREFFFGRRVGFPLIVDRYLLIFEKQHV
jgi:hypothetical protein